MSRRHALWKGSSRLLQVADICKDAVLIGSEMADRGEHITIARALTLAVQRAQPESRDVLGMWAVFTLASRLTKGWLDDENSRQTGSQAQKPARVSGSPNGSREPLGEWAGPGC